MEVRNSVEGPRIVRRRRIKGASIPETFHRWMELTRYPGIMLNILSKLPVYKVAQFRLVSRKWNAALSSSHFTSLLRLNSPEISWFVVNLKSAQGVDVLAAYSYSAKVWFKLPLSFLGRLGAFHVSVSSNSGLVAFFKKPRCEYGRHIVVFDPRKASLVSRIDIPKNKIVEADDPWYISMLNMVVKVEIESIALISFDSTNNYKLVAFAYGDQRALWVYNSLGKSWRKVRSFTTELIELHHNSFVRGNCAYFLARWYDSPQILIYNDEIVVEEGCIPAEFFRQDINLVVQPNLFCCREKLAMCDVVRKHRKEVHQDDGEEEASSQEKGEDDDDDDDDDTDDEEDSDYEGAGERFALVIWEREFGDGAGEWKEVARMPQEMWDEMYLNVDFDSFIRLRICGSANLVFLQLEEWKAVVCNLDTGCWEYLAPLPKKIGQKSYEDVFMLDLI